ncbi:peptidoglycan binding protein CsiV [Agarivorans sp. MS3-6]
MRLTLKNALRLISLTAIGLTSVPSMAEQPRWFDIEVIFFKRNVTVESSQEFWPQPQQLNVATSAPLLAPLFGCNEEPCIAPRFDKLPVSIDGRGWPITGATQRTMLSAAQLELNQEFSKLQQHAAFSPLLHIGWREIVAPRNRAKHYQVQAGQDFSQRFNEQGRLLGSINFSEQGIANDSGDLDLTAENISLFDEADSSANNFGQAPEPAPAIWELDGGIRVYLQHYLYIETELLLKRPVEIEVLSEHIEAESSLPEELALSPTEQTDNAIEEPQVVVLAAEQSVTNEGSLIADIETEEQLHSFKFDQKRRVRSGEIHYFDHPLMGMLIQIRKSPEAQTQLNQSAGDLPIAESAETTLDADVATQTSITEPTTTVETPAS